uniref:CX domain-containing protein n=1 Tax=Caenorhabditis tropicalis TaxID=1561998 RepID=A0A1I7TTD9_9PELO
MVLSFLIVCTTLSLKISSGLSKAIADTSDLPEFLNETIGEVTSSSLDSSTKNPLSTTNPSFKQRSIGMDLHCPSIENAVSTCPKDSNWVYYSCCGGANMYCCEHIQTWLLSALAIVAIFLSLLLIGCCVRCCCSYKRKTQQSYSFDDK